VAALLLGQLRTLAAVPQRPGPDRELAVAGLAGVPPARTRLGLYRLLPAGRSHWVAPGETGEMGCVSGSFPIVIGTLGVNGS